MNHVLSKLTSGRWLLTVCGGFTFSWCAITGILDSQAVAAIITAVFTAYFHRSDRKDDVEGGQSTKPEVRV